MNISIRLAWRNLWRHSRRTWLTVGAMIFSNSLLVFLISLQYAMYGMMVDNSLRMFTGHLQIQHAEFFSESRIENSFLPSTELQQNILNLERVKGIALRSEAFVLASSEERSYGIQVMGVYPEAEMLVSSIPKFIIQGSYLTDANNAEIVLGSILARNLKVGVGDEITLLGSGKDGSSAAAILKVVGILESGVTELDRVVTQIHIQQFDSIFSMEGEIHRLVIVADNIDELGFISESLKALVDPLNDTRVLDWNELQPELRQAIQSDMASSWFMYLVLIVLVAFSVLNTQLMSVLERTREYGIMLALGLSSWRLGKLLILETVFMSILGLVIGVGLGVCLVLYLGYAGFSYPGMEEMAMKFNLPGRIYPRITLSSAFFGPGLVFSASIFAAIYPAIRLYKLHIVQAMRTP